MKRILFPLALCALLVLNMGFQKKEKKTELSFQQRLDMELAKKVQKLKQDKYKECQIQLLERANQIADSTLLAEARALKTVPVDKPPKPEKPEQPELMAVQDSTEVAPFFDEGQ